MSLIKRYVYTSSAGIGGIYAQDYSGGVVQFSETGPLASIRTYKIL